MMNTKKSQMNFAQLMPEDLMDLTMFVITNLTLTTEKSANMVYTVQGLSRVAIVTDMVDIYV